MAPNNTQSPQSPTSNSQFDYLQAIALGQNPKDQDGNTTGPAVQGPSTGGTFVNGTYIPYNALANMPLPDVKQETSEVMKYLPEFSAGPYAQNPQQERITQQQFLNRANSPYMAFGANNRFAMQHPTAARAIDNMLLGGSLINQAHQTSLAAGHGLESAGGSIGDVLTGLLGIKPAQMAYRQNLEQQGFQRQLQQAQVKTAQTENLRNIMQAISAYATNPARQAGEIARGMLAAQVNAQGRVTGNQMTNAKDMFDTMMKGQFGEQVARIRAMDHHSTAFQNEQTHFFMQYQGQLNSLWKQNHDIQAKPDSGGTNPAYDAMLKDVKAQAQSDFDHQVQDLYEVGGRLAKEAGFSDFDETMRGMHGQVTPYPMTPPVIRKPVKPSATAPKTNAPANSGGKKQAYLQNGQWYDAQTHQPIK